VNELVVGELVVGGAFARVLFSRELNLVAMLFSSTTRIVHDEQVNDL
jgi:hypothetical protein